MSSQGASRRRTAVKKRARPAATRGQSRVASRRTGSTNRSRPALILGAAAAVVAIAAVGSVIVLPLQEYMAQGDEIERLATELGRLEDVNADLAAEVARLRTDDGIREAARDELGYVTDGESRQTIREPGDLPIDLPDGWPYGSVADIIALRTANP